MGTEGSRPSGWQFQPQSVRGKAVVVSGGTTGIGRRTAVLLASQGARVLIFGRHEPELNEALEELRNVIGSSGGEAHGLTADQSRREDVERVFAEADRVLGGVDILINNAGLSGANLLKGSYEDWEYVLRTNVPGYLACSRAALDRMRPRGSGHIVNVGSLSADLREPEGDVYAATKAAIQAFSEALRKEVNEAGIKVTLIEPGKVESEMTVSSSEEARQRVDAQEMLTAEDLAECIYYTLIQPPRCDVIVVQIRPHRQVI